MWPLNATGLSGGRIISARFLSQVTQIVFFYKFLFSPMELNTTFF